jgi:lysophospholipase L1-like esterase
VTIRSAPTIAFAVLASVAAIVPRVARAQEPAVTGPAVAMTPAQLLGAADAAIDAGNIEAAALLYDQLAREHPTAPEANEARRALKIIGATLTPFGNETFMANAWNPTRERHRVTVNTWMRESGAFDAVADFDAALRDPGVPTQMRAVDDCGDGLHPSDLGYCTMGDAIDLALFD